MTVTNSTFTGNTGEGHSIFNATDPDLVLYIRGELNVTNCTFSDNETGIDNEGGGIYNQAYSIATVTNSTFSGNKGPFSGILNEREGELFVTNTTFSGNTSNFYYPTVEGGAILNSGTATVSNSIFANNTATNCLGEFTDGGGNLVWGDTTCPGINADPKLGALANNGGPTQTMSLGAGSAAINVAVPSNCSLKDQRGYYRHDACDIGAFEYGGTPNPPTTTNLNSSLNPSVFGQAVTLTATVTSAFGTPTGGTVNFKDGGTSISGCNAQALDASSKATCTTAALSVASHTITAVYSGDADYSGSTSDALTQVVNCSSTITVTNANDSGAGSLREAIADVCTGGTLTFNGDYTIPLASPLTIAKNLTLDGETHTVTLDGQDSVKVLYVNTGITLNLNALTITRGNADGGTGGGILNWGTVNITNSTFSNNHADNVNSKGGGIYNYSGSTVTVTNSTFSNNHTDRGAGGGIYNNGGTVTVTNSIFADNHAINGSGTAGGINNNGGTVTVTNSTFSNNHAQSSGGAIYNQYNSTLNLINSTFAGNSGSTGGAIRNSFGTVIFKNTLLANSTSGGNCSNNSGTLTDSGGNLDDGATCGFSTANGSLANTNPQLGALTGSPAYFPLNTNSPAVDAGKNATCTAAVGSPNYGAGGKDQRGSARNDLQCDIGAYEFTVTDGNSVTHTPGSTSMTTFGPALAGIQYSGTAPGSTTVTRASWAHQKANAIAKYWDITPTNNSGLNASLKLCYLDGESRSLALGALNFWRSTDGGATFSLAGAPTSTNRDANGNNCATLTGVNAFSRWTLATNNPTAATLNRFRAKFNAANQRVNLGWMTTNELNVVGFSVWRQIAPKNGAGKGGEWKMLNKTQIAAKHAGELLGAKYTKSDKTVKVRSDKNHPQTYFYKIEIVFADGHTEWSEVERVVVK